MPLKNQNLVKVLIIQYMCLNYETFMSVFYWKNSLYKFKTKYIFSTLKLIGQENKTLLARPRKQNKERWGENLQSFYPVKKIKI